MKILLKDVHHLGWAVSLGALLAAAIPLVHAEAGTGHNSMHGAMQEDGAHRGEMHKARHGKGHDGRGKHSDQGKNRGKGDGGQHHRKRHKGHHLFGKHWRKTLTAEQKVQLDQLHLEFAKKKHTLKSGIHALKMQLAVMAVADLPQPEAIDAQIAELLMAKKQLMQAKYSYIAAQRRVLTPGQRMSFDMDVIHKADAGKSKGQHRGGKH